MARTDDEARRPFIPAEIPSDEAAYRKLVDEIVPLARTRYDVFVTTCFRTEQGAPIAVAPFQAEWITNIRASPRVVLWCNIESGKSMHGSIWFPLWLLAQSLNTRIVIVSNTQVQAEKFGRAIRETIKENQMFRLVFPHVQPGHPWSDKQFAVQRPAVGMKDASIQCIGVGGAILGARVDVMILDDILDFENTRTRGQRKKLKQWFESTLLTRITSAGRLICIGTKWHKEDLYHELARKPDFRAFTYRAILPDGSPLWPEQWPLERIRRKRAELGGFEFARQMMNDLRSPDTSRFDRVWFDIAKSKGVGHFTSDEYRCAPGEHLVCGVDLGGSERSSADLTSFHVIAGTAEYKRHVHMETGRWLAPEISRRLLRLHERMPELILAVESNGQQGHVIAMLRRDSKRFIPIIPHITTAKKYDRRTGVERIAFDFGQGRWIIPRPHSADEMFQMEAWLDDMFSYEPSVHLPDRLAATYFASVVLDQLNAVPVDLTRCSLIALLGYAHAGLAAKLPDGRIALVPGTPDCKPQQAVGWLRDSGERPPWPPWLPAGVPAAIYPATDENIRRAALRASEMYRGGRIAIKDPVAWAQVSALGPSPAWPHKAPMAAARYMALAVMASDFFDGIGITAPLDAASADVAAPWDRPTQKQPARIQSPADSLQRPADLAFSWTELENMGFPVLPPDDSSAW